MDFISSLKRTMASLTLSAMTLTLVGPLAQAAANLGFTDDAEIPSWSEESIEALIDQGVISGNDDGSFAPNRQLNRAEVSKIIVLATGIDFDTTGGPHFPDVRPGDWFYDYVETMYNYGWIDGYPDGLFRPGLGINRAEIAKMVVNAFELEEDVTGAPHFDDVSSSDWFYSYVETAYNYDLMRGFGDGTFGPANPVTRAETVKIVYDGQLAAFPVDADFGLAEGTLEVVLSGDTPRGTNVPFNATSVPYTTVELTASDDSDIEVSAITFTRLGLGDNDDFDNVWIEIDGFKVGNDKSVNNDDIVELRFNPPIVVPAGQTLVADIVASAKFTQASGSCNGASADCNLGHHNRFALVSADDIVSTASQVVGDFPIEGEEMEVADYEVSQLTFTTLGSDTTVDVGDNFIEIGKFRFLNGSNTNKDVELRAITFKNDGTAELEDNLENAALYVSGEQVSAETIIDGDYITFRLDNGVTGGYIIEDGDSRIFSLRADIVSAERNDTIQFKVDNFEDIVGVEIGTSFGVKAITGNTSVSGCSSTSDAEDSCATLQTYTIDSGDLNVSRDPSSLGNQEYAPGSNDVVVLTARLVVDQPLLVDGVFINIADGTSMDVSGDGTLSGASEILGSTTTDTQLAAILTELNNDFDNFRLFLNDKLIDTENDFVQQQNGSNSTTETDDVLRLDFNTTFEIAGTSILKVVMNVQDSADTGEKVKLSVSSSGFQSPEYISTGDQVDSSQLLGSAEGSFVEVEQSVLTVSETSGISDGDKIVAGVDDVTFLKFVLDNNDSGDVTTTSVTVTADQTDNATNAGSGVSGSPRNFSNFTVAIFVDGTQQGSAKNLDSSTGAATFNDLSVLIPSSGQKEFTVVVDTIEASASTISTTVNDGAIANTDTTLILADADSIQVGDIIQIAETTSNSTTSHAVTAVNTTTDTVTFTEALATATLPVNGDAVTVKHQVKFDVTAVDADNVENGQSVTITNGETSATLDTTTNRLVGVLYELVASGTLSVTLGTTVFSDIIVAGSEDVEVLKIRFNAADDEIQIKDLYLENDVDNNDVVDNSSVKDRLDFKLYDENGNLIQEKQMTSGQLHFELGNQDRIRIPKDDSTFVTVRADARDITKANQTGTRLKLSLDGDSTDSGGTTVRGIEAVTAATGDDIATPAAPGFESTAGDVAGQEFVVYRTQVSFQHAAVQPNFQDPSASSQEIYRFTATADSARQAELGTLTLDVSLSGMDFDGGNTFTLRQVKSDGTVDNSASPASSVAPTRATADGDTSARVIIAFSNQKLSAGESRTYALFVDATSNLTSPTDADDDAVSVSILDDSAYDAPTTLASQRTGVITTGTATGAGTTTTIVVSSTDAAKFLVGDTVLFVDASAAANNQTTTITAISGTTITVGDTLGAATAASDTIRLAGTTITAPAAGATDQFSTTVVEVTQAQAKTLRTGDTVHFIDASAGANNVDRTISTITNGTDAGSVLVTLNAAVAAAAVAGDQLVPVRVANNIVWSDESDPNHSNTTSDWLNGYFVDISTTSKVNAD